MATQVLTAENYDNALQSSKPVLVDFWASWCGPCRAMGPVVEQVGDEMAEQIDVYKCNVDEQPQLAQNFNIVSIPTLILFKGGKPVHQLVGAMSKANLVSEISSHI